MADEPFRHILVSSDLGPSSDRALMRAAALAADFGARLTLLHVASRSDPAARRRHALDLLADQAARLPDGLVTPEIRAAEGSTAQEIAAAIDEHGADLAVFGEHQTRLLDDIFAAGTAEKVMSMARCSLLVVRLPFAGPYREVLVATEASQPSRVAIRSARMVAPAAHFVVVHVVDTPFRSLTSDTLSLESAVLDQGRSALSDWLEAPDDDMVEPLVLIGDPVANVVETARERGCGLVAVSSRTTSRVVRFLLGSVASRVVREAPCDVLVVPPYQA
jgi:nucleotide-binding universal stress UspA family protein